MQLFNIVLFWLFFGFLCSFLAKRRGKNSTVWFFIGLFLGIFGVALILILPLLERKKPLPEPIAQPSLIPPSVHVWGDEWFYLDQSRQTQGPIAFSELHTLWKNKNLTDQSYLWMDGMETWKRIHDLPDLLTDLQKV